jgi:hypothetical protein
VVGRAGDQQDDTDAALRGADERADTIGLNASYRAGNTF